eukprot:7721677-Pyramimonas_sp.AAC.1
MMQMDSPFDCGRPASVHARDKCAVLRFERKGYGGGEVGGGRRHHRGSWLKPNLAPTLNPRLNGDFKRGLRFGPRTQ